MARRIFEMKHVVTYEETNAIGNVYFTNYFGWQGRCRELFLLEHAPELIAQLQEGSLRLVTAHACCDYFEDLNALELITVRMGLSKFIAHGLRLDFEYCKGGSPAVVARSSQDIKFLERRGSRWELTEVPGKLQRILQEYV
jgi:enediyne core biosynthesis thioesterase